MKCDQPQNGDRRLAFLTCDCVDEWLSDIDLDIAGLANEMSGGWFNCLQAIQDAGVKCVLYGTSSRVDQIIRIEHRPTGALICIFPSTLLYRLLKRLAGAPRTSSKRRGTLHRMLDTLVNYTSLPLLTFIREARRDRCVCLLVEQYGTPRFDICVLTAKVLQFSVFGLFASHMGGTTFLSHFANPLRPLSYRMCDGLIIASSAEIDRRKAIHASHPSRVVKIHYPVDTVFWHAEDKIQCRRSLGLGPDDRVAIWHGGIDVWVKGLDVLLAAWQRLNVGSTRRHWKLLIVGGGSPEESQKLNEIIARTGVTGVTFVDRWILDRELLRQYLVAADVYVFPSRSDAFGISALEAMACGLPAIISSGAGASEMLAEGESAGGIVVKSEDPDALAAALERLLADSRLSAEIGRRARQTVEASASMQSVGRQMVDFLFQHEPRSAAPPSQ